ncbi:sugar transporter [Penicillium sp. IBT 31633x]|nr:sugar transporter [Penicillium sp. IBT 31633x]
MSSSAGPEDSIRGLPWLIWVVVIFGSISSAGFGFDQAWWAGVMSSSQFVHRFGSLNPATQAWALTSQQQSLGTGVGYIGVIVGVLAGAPMNEKLGRKNTLWIQTLVVVVGVVIESTCTTSYPQFIVGKLVVYFAGGIATSVIPAYQGECAPKSLRGLMSGTYNAFMMIGGFAAALIVYLCQDIPNDWAWRVVVVAQVAIPFMGWISLPSLPESPYWLVSRGRLEDAAAALRSLRGPSFSAEAELSLMQQELLEQRERQSKATWASCVVDPINRRRTLISVGAQVLQQAQGISFVANYQAVFLQQIGFTEVLLMSVVVYVIGVVANLASMFLTDRLGRRRVMMCAAAMLGACMIIIGGLTTNGPGSMSYAMQVAAVVMLMLWFFFFQITWGPLPWVLAAELPPTQVREKMVALSGLSAYLTGLIIVFVNPYTQEAIGGCVAFIYGAFSVLAFVFVWFVVPELRQRSLEQIDEMFQEKLPTRAFKSYVCRVPGQVISDKSDEIEYVEVA